MQESVSVVGYPTGGDNVCVTKGVVSRIDRQHVGSVSDLSCPVQQYCSLYVHMYCDTYCCLLSGGDVTCRVLYCSHMHRWPALFIGDCCPSQQNQCHQTHLYISDVLAYISPTTATYGF